MAGAVDLTECPNHPRNCRCKPVCRYCGFGKHMAVHAARYGQPPGSEPYGHEFKPSPYKHDAPKLRLPA